MSLVRVIASIVAAAGCAIGPASAQEKLDMVLNFVASGDHAPFYFAKKQGWYKERGIDLSIEVGQGSGAAVQKVGAGKNQVGIADLGTVFVGRGKGADVVAAMAIYANSPFGMYWLKSSGITGPKDFAGKKYGVPAGDAGLVMWPAFARAVGLDPASITVVNVAPLAKLQMMQSRGIDFTQSFYSGHAYFSKAMGDDMGFLRWKDVGINPYSNAVIANAAFLRAKPEAARGFVQVSQRAFAACMKDPDPCLRALTEANSGLTVESEQATWRLVRELMDDEGFRREALGWFDPKRVAADYELIDKYFSIEKKSAPGDAVTNELLDGTVKLP
jgi:NitT/TauT family transport system substrate-binding protein